jgi:UMF1 family MFS transporter
LEVGVALGSENPTLTQHVPPYSRREQLGWCFYDWANGAFATIVVTVFLGPYLTTIAKSVADANGFVYPLGIPVAAGAFFPYMITLSVLLQLLLLPFLGAIADYSNRKREMLGLFSFIGAGATIGLYGVRGDNYLLGGVLFLIANLTYGAAIVVFNAFLPAIAPPDQRNGVSSLGWAMGYLGGGLLLLVNLILVSQAGALGLSVGEAVRIALASAGVWWAGFTLIPLATLRHHRSSKKLEAHENPIGAGTRQLLGTLGRMRNYPQTLLFLIAYLIYADGIHTVTTLASQFGQEELKLPISTLTTVILMVQFVAFFGSLGFNFVARAVGSKRAIVISLVIWSGTLVYAYAFLRTEAQFFFLAAVIAVVLGGSQALSRSVFSQMIPRHQEAEYFSLYELSDRGTSWLGPLLFGLALQFTSSYRVAILSLIVFFVVGLALLSRVDVRLAAAEAGNEVPARA